MNINCSVIAYIVHRWQQAPRVHPRGCGQDPGLQGGEPQHVRLGDPAETPPGAVKT